MTCFVSAKDFPKKLVKGYRIRSWHPGRRPFRFHFNREIYNWCRKNKICYRRVDGPDHGFLFESKADVMAIKLRWM